MILKQLFTEFLLQFNFLYGITLLAASKSDHPTAYVKMKLPVSRPINEVNI